jgi:hypothetical protein
MQKKSEIEIAAAQFIRRQNRTEHPAGKFDKAGRFELANEERRTCCAGIRTPSRAYPYSEMIHGRSAQHVAHLHHISRGDIIRQVNVWKKESQIEYASAMQLVKVDRDF